MNEEMTREEIHEIGLKRQRAAGRLVELHIMSNGSEIEWLLKHYDDIPSHICPLREEDAYSCWEDDEGNVREVTQWWHVTRDLANMLEEKGEATIYIDDWDKYYWGRTCYGQALALDWVLQEIAVEWFGLK